jgi:hypothetical protein
MNSYAAQQARQAAQFHAHPAMWSIFPLLFVVVVISAVILVRWLMSKNAWPYHPGGSSGFLRDEVIRYASIWLPFAIVMVAVRYYIYRFHPELTSSPYLYALYLSIFVFRRLARLLPHVREIGARIDGARARAKAATEGVTL